MKVKRALLSVSDKSGLNDFAVGLRDLGIEVISTGGTCRQLREVGVDAIEVSDKTGFPEIMDGRVKTLHPTIHGGLLGRRGTDDAIMDEHGIEPIDLLVVNLYPFEATIARRDASFADAVENIDIGGPAMIRAASKNHESVVVIVDPNDYGTVLDALRDGGVGDAMRRGLAAKAYAHTARYDTAISQYLSDPEQREGLGERFLYTGERSSVLRYGENPHQQAAFYRDAGATEGTLAGAHKIQGKELSYNNIADSDAALECVRQFESPACVIVKHANPCGVAVDTTPLTAYERAYQTDPTSAFGGIIAFNRTVDAETATTIIDRQFVEVMVAPDYEDAALEALATKKNLRVLKTGDSRADGSALYDYKKVSGGLLVQTSDDGVIGAEDLEVVTEWRPSDEQIQDLLFAWKVVKYVKSNAIVFCKDGMTVGVGAGQMSRVYSTKIAAIKASDEGLSVEGAVMASDAFFPFRDGIDAAAEHKISAIIQPGGSMRDEEVIAAANEHEIAMVFTRMRHFRH